MKDFSCKQCNSKDVFKKNSGNNVGLYCSDCGKWQTWLSKDDSRLVDLFIERQICANIKQVDYLERINSLLESYSPTQLESLYIYLTGN